MNLNYRQLGMYLLVGVASGILCILQGNLIGHRLLPGFVLGVMILLAGRYISRIGSRHLLLSPLILILFCGTGWYLASQHGANAYASGGYVSLLWEVESGVIGGLFVGTGLAIAWKLKSIWVVILLVTVAGGLGGVLFVLQGTPLDEEQRWMFVYWQGLVLLSIGVAVQINSNKSSIKQ